MITELINWKTQKVKEYLLVGVVAQNVTYDDKVLIKKGSQIKNLGKKLLLVPSDLHKATVHIGGANLLRAGGLLNEY